MNLGHQKKGCLLKSQFPDGTRGFPAEFVVQASRPQTTNGPYLLTQASVTVAVGNANTRGPAPLPEPWQALGSH